MKVCPKCGTKYENGNFCENCETEDGNPVRLEEQKISCPQCGKLYPAGTKFCSDCGVKLGASSPQNNAGISMGDKNVVAGDVIGKKDETNISGNATIIKNEDETKKTSKCHVCGRIVLRLEGYDSPVCGQFSCKDHFDIEKNKCLNCVQQDNNEIESIYKEALIKALEDGIIDINERNELSALQNKLGLSPIRAMELEKNIKNNPSMYSVKKSLENLGTFDQLTVTKAVKELYENNNPQKAIELIEPLTMKYTMNENIISIYLNALLKIDLMKVSQIVNSLNADILCAYLADIDLSLIQKNYSDAEEKIHKAEQYWGNNVELKCRHVSLYLVLIKETGDFDYLQTAKQLLDSCGEGSSKLERSLILKTKLEFSACANNRVVSISENFCDYADVYKYFFLDFETTKDFETVCIHFFEDGTYVYVRKNNHLILIGSIQETFEYDNKGVLIQESLENTFNKLKKMFVEKGIKPENLLISVRHILISEHRRITAECQKYGYKLLRALSYNKCIFLSRSNKTYGENNENDGPLIEGIVGLSDNCFNYEKSVIADGVIEVLISKEASYDFIDSLSENLNPDTSYESQQSLQKLVIYGHSEYLNKYYNTIRTQLGIEAEFIDDYKSEVISGLDVLMNILNGASKDLLLLDSIISSVGIKKVNHDYEEVLFCNTCVPTKKIIELGENCSPVLKIVEKFRENLIDLDEISDSGKSVSLSIEANLILNSKVE